MARGLGSATLHHSSRELRPRRAAADDNDEDLFCVAEERPVRPRVPATGRLRRHHHGAGARLRHPQRQMPNVAFTWTSSDTLFAKVSNKGRLTALANGLTTIRASVAGDTAALAVTVQQVPAHFAFTPALPVALTALGADTSLAAGAVDSLGNPIKGNAASPTWGLQSVGVITIDQSGSPVGRQRRTYVYASQIRSATASGDVVPACRRAL